MSRKDSQKDKEYFKAYYIKNRAKIIENVKRYAVANSEKRIASQKEYILKNKVAIAAQTKKYRETHAETISQWRKDVQKTPEYKTQRSSYLKEKYSNDPQHRIRVTLRNRLNDAVKNSFKSGSAIRNLGCSIGEFKFYLEGRFKDGMSWSNMGKWHIDHELPLALFDLSDPEQLKRACHYTNLQPLWAKENIIKGKKILV